MSTRSGWTRVVVMGLGRFGGGEAVARYYARRRADVLVTDLRDETALAGPVERLRREGVRFRFGPHDPADFRAAEIIAVNPAVPFDHPLVAEAAERGAEIVTEIGLTVRAWPGPVVAVTGTNGKSTTAALCAAMLEEAGRPVHLGGNIGRSLLPRARLADFEDIAVLELSSFQLSWLEHDLLSPVAGIVTNVSGDHFDRHPDLDHYVAAKRRLARSVPSGDVLALNRDDEVCRTFGAGRQRARVCWFGRGEAPPIPLDGLRLRGTHNRLNAAAAALAALAAGADEEACLRAAARFTGLPHRMETVREARGVRFVDDSVSTTPEATAAAVEAFGGGGRVVLLAGGRDKGVSWRPLLDAARAAKAVVAYGESGPRLREKLPRAHLFPVLESAVRFALEVAEPGDTVLLSPGFSSHDEFAGFDARGRRFRELVDAGIGFAEGGNAAAKAEEGRGV